MDGYIELLRGRETVSDSANLQVGKKVNFDLQEQKQQTEGGNTFLNLSGMQASFEVKERSRHAQYH